MGFLPDHSLKEWAAQGGVIPLDEDNINPASFDLRLGHIIRIPRWYWNPITRWAAWHLLGRPDPRQKAHLYWSKEFLFERFTLWPGRSVLGESLERTIIPDDCVGFLLGKSTTCRILLEPLHAGFGDPGFGSKEQGEEVRRDEFGDGLRGNGEPGGDTWTFELTNLGPWPIELIAEERLLQLALGRLESRPTQTYRDTGRYRGQSGPTPARPALKMKVEGRPEERPEKTLDRYNRLIKRFGQAGIDDILYPCWEKDLILYNRNGEPSYPYADFVYNMTWFEGVVQERDAMRSKDKSSASLADKDGTAWRR